MNTVPTALGEHGSTWVSIGTAMSGTIWCAITVVANAVFATINDASQNWSTTNFRLSTAFAAGVTIYGSFTDFTLTSGAVIAYRAGAS